MSVLNQLSSDAPAYKVGQELAYMGVVRAYRMEVLSFRCKVSGTGSLVIATVSVAQEVSGIQ